MVKNPPANAGDMSSIPGRERAPEGGNGNPLQHSCWSSPVAREVWQATVHAVAESDTAEQLSVQTYSQAPNLCIS